MRAIGSTAIKWQLFEIPTKIYSLRSTEEKVSFMGLSDCCKSQLKSHKNCSSCGKEQKWITDDKGYKVSKDTIVPLTKQEIETIEKFDAGVHIVKFVDKSEVPETALDKPYLLEATGSHKVYALIREALMQQNKVAVVRAIIKGNEHIGILRHDKEGIVLQYIERLNAITIVPKEVKVADSEKTMFSKLIEANSGNFDFDELHSSYFEGVAKLISKKLAGEKIEVIEQKIKETNDDIEATMKAMLDIAQGKKQIVEKVVM